MDKQRYLLGTAAFMGMLILILDGKTATQGAYDGIILCMKTVIPSLFPFFVLSNLMNGTFTGTKVRLLQPLAKICRLPDGLESLLVPAFLGGYPVGAQAIAQGWRSGQIPKAEAERLLGFCNNAGPSFLFGMAAVMFPERWMVWMLWIIHIASAVLTSRLIPGPLSYTGSVSPKAVSVSMALHGAMAAMASVCGWVIFFRVVIAFLDRWVLWLLPAYLQVIVMGLMELTNGCLSLHTISHVGIRFSICAGMLCFGGLRVRLQVLAVAQGLSPKWFFIGKLIQTAASIALSWTLVSGEWIVFGFLTLLLPFAFLKSRKKSSFPGKAGV